MNPMPMTMPMRPGLMHRRAAAGRAATLPAAAMRPASALATLLCASLVFAAAGAHAVTYKWIDDQGIVHYTDKMPADAINKGNVELNKQGIPIKKTDPALTPEQRRVKEAEDERIRQAARAREEVARKDRALLQTYTTESEIDLARKRALGTIDGQINSAQGYSTTLSKRKQEIEARLTALGDKPVPPALERELNNINDELDKQADLITTKKKEAVAVNARYDADKRRWQELAAMAPADGNPAPTSSTQATSYPSNKK